MVTVNDLTGTDLKHANINLAATAGGGDGQPDIVIANGTEGPDKVHVNNVTGNVIVTGLSTEVAVRAASQPTTDCRSTRSAARTPSPSPRA